MTAVAFADIFRFSFLADKTLPLSPFIIYSLSFDAADA